MIFKVPILFLVVASFVITIFMNTGTTDPSESTTTTPPSPPAFNSDWGNLTKYAASTAELSQLPTGSNQVVFMGDSITECWDFAHYFPDKAYVNRGIWGQITSQMLLRFRSEVINLHPKVTVIHGGVNDIAVRPESEYISLIEGNLASMAELAAGHGIQVVMASVLPVCGRFESERSPESIVKINKFIRGYCEEKGFVYVDYHSALVGDDGLLRPELTWDCLHLTGDGYDIMAPLAQAAIDRAMRMDNIPLEGRRIV